MKKLLIAFEESDFSEGIFEFVRQLNEVEPCMVTATFLPHVKYADLWSYGGSMPGAPLLATFPDDSEEAQKNIHLFESHCQKNGISYRVHAGAADFSLAELVRETRFADLMVLQSSKFYSFLSVPDPGNFIKDIINQAECPVIVVPEVCPFPQKLVLAYDGHASSVFAFKEFANIFPALAQLPAILVYAHDDVSKPIPDLSYLEELLPQHYSQLEIMKVHLDSRQQFGHWVSAHPDSMLITGAFGRSAISSILRKSYVTDVIAAQKLPVFIAHR